MEKTFAKECLDHYVDVEKLHFDRYPEDVKLLNKLIGALQRFIDDNDFVLDEFICDNGKYGITYNYKNSSTRAVTIIMFYDCIHIEHHSYYGNIFYRLDENGLSGDLSSIENTCFRFNNEGLEDYTLKLDYKFESEDLPGKISEVISHAKNYYPKAFKAKCAKQREREIMNYKF